MANEINHHGRTIFNLNDSIAATTQHKSAGKNKGKVTTGKEVDVIQVREANKAGEAGRHSKAWDTMGMMDDGGSLAAMINAKPTGKVRVARLIANWGLPGVYVAFATVYFITGAILYNETPSV